MLMQNLSIIKYHNCSYHVKNFNLQRDGQHATYCRETNLGKKPVCFVVEELMNQEEWRRVRLSDFVVVVIYFALAEGKITKGQVDRFESEYKKGAILRAMRPHEGHPALAPDGSVLVWDDKVMQGSTNRGPGTWTVLTVSGCVGYADWLKKLLQSRAT
jgi:hypothetical protein